MQKNNVKFIFFLTAFSSISFFLLFFCKEIHSVYVYYTFHISYLFTEPVSQLKEYYPKFYLLVFLVTRIIKFGLPLLAFLYIYKNRYFIKSCINLFKITDEVYWWKTPVYFFFSGLVVVLLFYYTLFYGEFVPQLLLSKLFLSIQLLFLGLFTSVNYKFLLSRLTSFLFKPILPYSISITRLLFFSYLFFLYLGQFKRKAYLVENLEKVALPGIAWLIEIIPINAELYVWMCYAGALAAFFIIIGFKTRFFLLLNTLIVFYVVATPNFFGKLWHEQLVIWIAWIMAFSSSFDVLSIDSYLNKKPLQKSGNYGFHLKMIWLHFGMIYFFAGFYKLWLCGFDWALSQSMINQVHLEWFEHYNKIPAFRIDYWPSLLMAGGLLVILFELFYFAFLFHKKTRWISVIGGLIMHNTIGYFMYISFLHLLQAFYMVFIPWNTLLKKLKLIKEPVMETQNNISLKKWALVIPVFILSMNILYGVFRIDSYPFSVYPVYAAIVPESFKYFEYKILDKGYEKIDVHQLGKENYFRWESYSRFEPEIINKYEETGVLDTSRVAQQWHRWQNGVPELQKVDSIEVYAVEVYLNPEKQQDTISKYKLMDL